MKLLRMSEFWFTALIVVLLMVQYSSAYLTVSGDCSSTCTINTTYYRAFVREGVIEDLYSNRYDPSFNWGRDFDTTLSFGLGTIRNSSGTTIMGQGITGNTCTTTQTSTTIKLVCSSTVGGVTGYNNWTFRDSYIELDTTATQSYEIRHATFQPGDSKLTYYWNGTENKTATGGLLDWDSTTGTAAATMSDTSLSDEILAIVWNEGVTTDFDYSTNQSGGTTGIHIARTQLISANTALKQYIKILERNISESGNDRVNQPLNAFKASQTYQDYPAPTSELYMSMVSGSDSYPGNSTHPIRSIRRLLDFNTAGLTIKFDQSPGNFWDMADDYFFNQTSLDGGSAGDYTNLTCYNCDTSEIPRPTLGATHLMSASEWTQVSGSLWKYSPGKGVAEFLFGNITDDNNITTGYRHYQVNSSLQGREGYKYLTSPKDWWQNRTFYWDSGVGKTTGDYVVYINSTGNPVTTYGSVRVVISEQSGSGTTGTCFEMWSGGYYSIQNLHFRGCDVGVNSDRDNVKIINNTFSYIGGGFCLSGCSGFTRWGNAIQAWLDADNWEVLYNKVYEVLDAALSPQGTTTGSAPTASNQEWAYNKIWNVGYCFEHYYSSPTSATSTNIKFHHNTCYNIGQGWYKSARANFNVGSSNYAPGGQTDQTATPRHIRFGESLNVVGLNVSDNIFYNTTNHLIGFQQVLTSNPGWNTSTSYYIENNFYYKTLDPQFNNSIWFFTNGITSPTSLTNWQYITVHDDSSITESTYPFTTGPPTFTPRATSGICTLSHTASYVGATPCPESSSKTVLTNAQDVFTSPADDFSGDCVVANDGDWDSGVEAEVCSDLIFNYTNPGNLRSGESKFIVKERAQLQSNHNNLFNTRTITLPSECEQSVIQVKAQPYFYNSVSDYEMIRYYCYNGATWTELLSFVNEYDTGYGGPYANTYIYEAGLNFSRTDYIQMVSPTPNNASNISSTFPFYTWQQHMGGTTQMTQRIYNSTGDLIASYTTNSATQNATRTLPKPGIYTINASVENDTHIAYSESRVYFSSNIVTIDTDEYKVYNNSLNLTWYTLDLLDSNSIFTIDLFNSSGWVQTINASTTYYYQFIDFKSLNVPVGNYTLRVVVNDTQSGIYDDDTLNFYLNLTTTYTINAQTVSNNSLQTFTIIASKGGVDRTFITTNGAITAILDRGHTYNFTLSSTGYLNSSILYGTNDTQTTLTFNISDLSQASITALACGAGLTTGLMFDLKDEESLTSTSANISYKFTYGNFDSNLKTIYGNLSNTPDFKFCFNSTSGELRIGHGEIHYTTSGYEERRYYLFNGTRVTSTTNNITLYNILTTSQTSFKLEVESTSLAVYDDKYTALLRWYPALNDYEVVDMGLTDETGSTVIHVVPENVDYRIAVYEKDGTLIKLANPIRMICLANPCTYTLKIGGGNSAYNEFLNIQHSLTFNDTGGTWNFAYSDPSQTNADYTLTIYRDTPTNTYSLCTTNSNGYVGAMTCNTSEYTGTLRGEVIRSVGKEIPIATKIVTVGSTAFRSTWGLFLTGLIVIPVVFVFAMVSPVAGIIGVVIALIPAVYFGSVTFGIVAAIAVMGGVSIHFIKRVT